MSMRTSIKVLRTTAMLIAGGSAGTTAVAQVDSTTPVGPFVTQQPCDLPVGSVEYGPYEDEYRSAFRGARRLRAGHRRGNECRVDYARPFGESVRMINQAQVSRGDAAQMVLYDFDFRDGESLLNLAGLRRLDRIARMMPCNFYPIIIEAVDHDPALAESRRQEVLNVLASAPSMFPVPAERVVIADPLSPGLDGLDAVIVSGKLLGLTTTGVGAPTSGLTTADVPVIAPLIVGPQQ